MSCDHATEWKKKKTSQATEWKKMYEVKIHTHTHTHTHTKSNKELVSNIYKELNNKKTNKQGQKIRADIRQKKIRKMMLKIFSHR